MQEEVKTNNNFTKVKKCENIKYFSSNFLGFPSKMIINFDFRRNKIENLDEILKRQDVNRGELILRDKVFFITGATGFLGGVFVEKVLRTVPTIKKIYLLIRPKKGKEPNERLKELFKKPVSNSFILLLFICY